MAAVEGASGINYKDKCPICGSEPRKDYCQDREYFILCPNEQEDCKNNSYEYFDATKKNEYIRKSCWGYLCGNIGIGTFLGSNIMVYRYSNSSLSNLKSRGGTKYRSLNAYKKKVMQLDVKILKGFALETDDYDLVKETRTNMVEELKQLKEQNEGNLYGYNGHPLHVEGGCIQGHHLICSESMNDDKWKAICKQVNYNINCWKNGIFLPAILNLACHLGYPLHRGNHNLGRGVTIGKTYVDEVKRLINGISKAYTEAGCNEDTQKEFIEKLNKKSEFIFEKVKNFTWTLTWDGGNYNKSSLTPYIGCANASGIEAKREKIARHLKKKGHLEKMKGLVHETKGGNMSWQLGTNDMLKLTRFGNIHEIGCDGNHDEFAIHEPQFKTFNFDIGN